MAFPICRTAAVPLAFSPSWTAVNTIRVDEFNANASTGDTSGGTVDITTKSGTNQFHGSIAEYYQDSKVGGAKPYLYPTATLVSSPLQPVRRQHRRSNLDSQGLQRPQ